MKICLYPYTEGSGIGTYIIELAAALSKHHDVHVIGEAKELAEKNKLQFHQVPSTLFALLRRVKQLPPFSLIEPFFFGPRLSALVNSIHPDIFHTADHLPYHTITVPIIGVAWDFPKRPRECCKLAAKYSSVLLLPYRCIREMEMSIKDHLALQKVKLSLGITHYVTNALAEKGYNVIYFPPGITLPEQKEKKKETKNETLTITFVGRHHILTKRKGLRYLLDALAMVHDRNHSLQFTLQLIGEIPPRFTNVREKYSQLQIHVLGLLPREEALAYIARSHLLVAPSLYDEFGYAVLEAQALGTAALVSKHNPSFSELVDKEFTVDIYNPEEFSRVLEHLLSNKQRLISIGKDAKEFVKEYFWQRKIPALTKLYKDVYEDVLFSSLRP